MQATAPPPETSVWKKTLGIEGAGAMLVRIAVVPLGLAIQVLGARSIGVDGYGRWQALIVLVDLICFAGKLGMDTASIRFATDYYQRARWPLLHGLHRATLAVGFAASLSLGVVWLCVSLISGSRWPLWAIALGVLLAAATVVLELAAYLLRALDRQVLSATLLFFLRHCGVLALVGTAATGLAASPALETLIGAQLSSTVIAALVAVVTLWRMIPSEQRHAPAYDLRTWMHVSMPLWIVTPVSSRRATPVC